MEWNSMMGAVEFSLRRLQQMSCISLWKGTVKWTLGIIDFRLFYR
jgi:hypothetical protein